MLKYKKSFLSVFILLFIYTGLSWYLGKGKDHLVVVHYVNETLKQVGAVDTVFAPWDDFQLKENKAFSKNGIFGSKKVYTIEKNGIPLPVTLDVSISHSPLFNGLNRYKATYQLDLSNLASNETIKFILSGFKGKKPLTIIEKKEFFDSKSDISIDLNIAPYKINHEEKGFSTDVNFSGLHGSFDFDQSQVTAEYLLNNLDVKAKGRDVEVAFILKGLSSESETKGKNVNSLVEGKRDIKIKEIENSTKLKSIDFNLSVPEKKKVQFNLKELDFSYDLSSGKHALDLDLSLDKLFLLNDDKQINLNDIEGELIVDSKNFIKEINQLSELVNKFISSHSLLHYEKLEELLTQSKNLLLNDALFEFKLDFKNEKSNKFDLKGKGKFKSDLINHYEPIEFLQVSFEAHKLLLNQVFSVLMGMKQNEIESLFNEPIFKQSKKGDQISLELIIKDDKTKINNESIDYYEKSIDRVKNRFGLLDYLF